MIRLLIVYSDRTCICTRTYTFKIAQALHQYKHSVINCDVIHYEHLNDNILQHYEVVIFQRLGANGTQITNPQKQQLKELIQTFKDKITFIYHIDDALFQNQKRFPIELMELCHSVLVPTPYMKELVSKYQPSCEVIPIPGDVESHERAPACTLEPNDVLHVGWFSNQGYGTSIIQEILPVLEKRYQGKLLIHCYAEEPFCSQLAGMFNTPLIAVHSRVAMYEMYSLMKGMSFLINPVSYNQKLIDFLKIDPNFIDDFLNAKTQIKFVHAGAVNIPIISTPTAPFKQTIVNGENGLLAATTQEWLDAFEVLIESPEKRRNMGQHARRYVESHHSLLAMANSYERLLKKVVPKQREYGMELAL